jgi:GNAT superfamily N-acetyltransferase
MTPATRLRFRDAVSTDVPRMAGLHNAAAGASTARYGEGPWSSFTTERAVELSLRHARVRIGVLEKSIVTVLRLAKKKPWAIDVDYFTSVRQPLYLTGMVVSVAHQGHGFGRIALDDARAIATQWPAHAIRLDAYDANAGAGGFYAKCGYDERGRVSYRGTPLVYYELLV